MVTSVGLARLTAQGGRHDGAGAATWIGTDGLVSWMGNQSTSETVETQLAKGGQPFVNTYPMFVLVAPPFEEALKATWVLERRGPETELSTSLLGVTDQGIATLGTVHTTAWALYHPGRTDIPADPQVGRTWSQQGLLRTQTDEALQWTSQGEVLAGTQAGCLRFRISETWSNGHQQTNDLERCPGRGIVADHGRGLMPIPGRVGDLPEINLTPTSTAPTSLTPQRLTVKHTGQTTSPIVSAAPVVMNGAIALVNRSTGNLMVGVARGDQLTVLWERHPGGASLTLTGFGDLVVVGTTQRRLIAYTTVGHRVWEQATDDVVTHALAVSPQRLLALTATGTVTVHDVMTGQVVWTRDLGTDRQSRPTLWGDTVVIPFEESLWVLDVRTGETRTQRHLPSGVDFATATPDGVLLYDNSGHLALLGYDGRLRWETVIASARYRDGALVGDSSAVVVSEDGAAVVDLATGRRRPVNTRADHAVPFVVDGRPVVLAVQSGGWTLVGADTAVLARDDSRSWTTVIRSVSSVTTESNGTRTAGATVGLDSDGALWLWGTP